MKSNFLLQIIATGIIVGVIYVGVLYANEGVQQWDVAALEQKENVKIETTKSADIISEKPAIDEVEKASEISDQTIFNSLRLIGRQQEINVSDAKLAQKQVSAAWQSFYAYESLHEALDWSGGELDVYAYYDQIADDFSTARLTLGYEVSKVRKAYDGPQVQTKSGSAQTFAMIDGRSSNDAWKAVYPDGVLLEHYRVSTTGDVKNINSIVIK